MFRFIRSVFVALCIVACAVGAIGVATAAPSGPVSRAIINPTPMPTIHPTIHPSIQPTALPTMHVCCIPPSMSPLIMRTAHP